MPIRSLITCAAIMFLAGCQTAAAHDWYDPDCCSGQDCAPAPVDGVSMGPDGYVVSVPAEAHPHSTRDINALVPFNGNQLRPSRDGQYHVCATSQGGLLCLYVPLGS